MDSPFSMPLPLSVFSSYRAFVSVAEVLHGRMRSNTHLHSLRMHLYPADLEQETKALLRFIQTTHRRSVGKLTVMFKLYFSISDTAFSAIESTMIQGSSVSLPWHTLHSGICNVPLVGISNRRLLRVFVMFSNAAFEVCRCYLLVISKPFHLALFVKCCHCGCHITAKLLRCRTRLRNDGYAEVRLGNEERVEETHVDILLSCIFHHIQVATD